MGCMSTPIEDYALLADLMTGPLVSRDGSIDWLCFPRFDSGAIFTAILGTPDDGRWKLSIAGGQVLERRYLDHSFVRRGGPDGGVDDEDHGVRQLDGDLGAQHPGDQRESDGLHPHGQAARR